MSANVAGAVAAVALWVAIFLLWVQPCQARIPPNYVSSRRGDPHFGRAYREVSRWFWRYVDAERGRLDSIRRRLDRLEVAQRSYDGVDPEQYLGLPMNAFLLIKRLARDYVQVLEEARDDTNAKLLLAMRPGGKRARRYQFPSKKDVSKAAHAVLEFQKNQGYTAKQIADGLAAEPNSSLYNFQMTARDCFHLGVAASEAEDGESTQEWMLEALDRAADGTVDAAAAKEYLAYGYFLEGDYQSAADTNNQLLEEDPSNMRAFLNMEFYQEGGPGHCYASPATLLEMTLFKKLTHPARTDKTCTRLRSARQNTYEGQVYREQVVREPTTIVFHKILSSTETSALRRVSAADGVVVSGPSDHTLRELTRKLEEVTDMKVLASKIPWKQLVSYCQEHTWLNPGNNLRSKPFATWWVFTGPGVLGGLDRSLFPQVILDSGMALLRYHVMSDGTRDREPIPYSCRSDNVTIFYKHIMLEDQRVLCQASSGGACDRYALRP
ncbi:prolyl 4-hydroxylase subunit alpha-3-like [Dermacentor andersoni]|uniref:prolyl 4-hydroxylase subunit alpha-3-like n=1 Tax=Dermacentor andersoni TaxID=34620 RepID=UPI0021557D78|nr:prolyl 4-hydroxylase subunit alpha-3-like [Dermacentor andersoni]